MSYEFTEQDVDATSKKIINDLLAEGRFSPVSEPKLYLLGGQPGSGKSTISNRLMNEYPNTVFINPDTYREFHPQYAKVKLCRKRVNFPEMLLNGFVRCYQIRNTI